MCSAGKALVLAGATLLLLVLGLLALGENAAEEMASGHAAGVRGAGAGTPSGERQRLSPTLQLEKGAREILVVECASSIATGVAVGLLNRGAPTADCFSDAAWADKLRMKVVPGDPLDALKLALTRGLLKGRVLYDYGNHISENLAISAAGIHDLLPEGSGDPVIAKALAALGDAIEALPALFDFREARNDTLAGGYFESYSQATKFTLDALLASSNNFTFAFRPPEGKIVPFIAMERMVAVFVDDLPAKCIEYNLVPINALAEAVAARNGLKPFLDLTSSAHWDVSKRPLTMMGFAPGLMESTGFCTRNKTMGVSASDIADSLSLILSVQRAAPETAISPSQSVAQPPFPRLRYDPNMRYVCHIVSDGDNLDLLGATFDYLAERRAMCANASSPCPPRAWTISGNTKVASAAIRSYYDIVNSYPNAPDSFLLPPSGATYFYPAAAKDAHGLEQQRAATIEVAQALGIRATILWDFFFQFATTKHREYIRGFIGSSIEAIFFSAAPWLLSPNENAPFVKLGYKSDQVYRDRRDPTKGVVVFQELTRWDGLRGEQSANGKRFSVEEMAQVVASQTKGSLNFVFDISWGIHNKDFLEYAAHLAAAHPDVQLVDHRTLIDLAKQKHGLK